MSARAIIIAVTLLLFCAIGWMVMSGHSKLPPSQQLPDGTVVSITKIYCGKAAVIPKGNSLQRMAAEILPVAITERLGIGETISWSSNATFIFVECHRTNGFSKSLRGTTTIPAPFFRPSVFISDGVHDIGVWPRDAAISDYGNTSNTEVQVIRIPRVSNVVSKMHLRLTHIEYPLGPSESQSVDFIVPYPTANSKPR